MTDKQNLSVLEREHLVRYIRGIHGFDKTIKEVIEASEENQKKIRRRVEDYLRKCNPTDLAIVAVICGIRTEVK